MTSQKLDIYEFKMALFGNGEPEEFLFFIRNFNMNVEASGTIAANAKIQYIFTLLHVEGLHHVDMLSTEVGITTLENLKNIILGLGT